MKTFFSLFCHSRVILAGILSVLFTSALYTQTTTMKLPSTDSSSSFRVLNSSSSILLRLNGDNGFYFGGTYGTGVIPAIGAGMRLMWYPKKAAFRAGYVNGAQWDDANVGYYSTAMGYSTTASGDYSTAMGYNATASEIRSTAMGSGTTASGAVSVAMGNGTEAKGSYSTAMGRNTVASGSTSTAMGMMAEASGMYSIAMGNQPVASGNYSIALGMGVSTNGHAGSFIFGDSTLSVIGSSAVNQMTMRFSGGYRFFTNSTTTIGCSLAAGGNSWQTISDSTKKEKYKKANGEYFLSSLSKLKLGSWNYKGQEPAQYRHYGPMAQEIFQYFGKDEYGTIGEETSLASADMDGIMMICLQALEKRTSELQKANEKITEFDKIVSEQNVKLHAQQTSFDDLKKEVERIKNDIRSLTETKTEQTKTNITLNQLNKGQ